MSNLEKLSNVRGRIKNHDAVTIPNTDTRRGAVAVILSEDNGSNPNGIQLLFIKRANRPSDPWSGHLAFPGGRINVEDKDPRMAAERETKEEIGLELKGSEFFGQLDDLHTVTTSMLVSAFVYEIDYSSSFDVNTEVAEVFWYPVSGLLYPQRHAMRRFDHRGVVETWPSIDLRLPNLPFLWGVTYRFIVHLLKLMSFPMPAITNTPLED